MTQTKLGGSLNGGRLFKSVTSSVLGLSALVGAVVLSGVEAKALGWSPNPVSPTFEATGPAATSIDFTSIPVVNKTSPWLADKRITYLDSNLPNAIAPYNLEFAFNPAFSRPWQVDLDFPLAGTDASGYFVYKIEIDPINSNDMARCIGDTGNVCYPIFGDVELFGTTGVPITKEIGTGYSGGNITGKIGSTLTLNVPSTPDNPVAYNVGGTTLYVKQSWNPSPGNPIDQIGDRYNQKVPGPLPILSAPLAFGFYRKLRSNSKLLRKFA
jgi:hypothetical protein